MSRRAVSRIARRQAGFSLVELLLALALTAAIMVPLLGLVRTTAAASGHTGPRFDLERQAAFAVQRIAAQVRGGAPIANYSLSGGKLIETNGTVASTLAESVTDFTQSTPASAAGQQLVLVSLTLARDGATATASATIRAGGAR